MLLDDFDPDNYLLENIKFSDAKVVTNQALPLTPLDEGTALGLCLDVKNSNPVVCSTDVAGSRGCHR